MKLIDGQDLIIGFFLIYVIMILIMGLIDR